MNNVQKPYDATNSSSDSSSIIERLSYILTTVESNPTQQHTNDIKLIDRLLVEEVKRYVVCINSKKFI